jgi:hypothetical protein
VVKRSTSLITGVLAVFGAVAAGAFAHSNPVPPALAAVGPLRIVYPSDLHRRYFSSCSYAATGIRSGACVRGVVVASYPLKPNPELGARDASFRSDGVLFELCRAPTQQPVATRNLPPPVSLADFHPVGKGMRATGEQRELFFRAKRGNYAGRSPGGHSGGPAAVLAPCHHDRFDAESVSRSKGLDRFAEG